MNTPHTRLADSYRRTIADLEAENALLREALGHYADPENWGEFGGDDGHMVITFQHPECRDNQIAKEALEAKP